jgi:hypothetical protein
MRNTRSPWRYSELSEPTSGHAFSAAASQKRYAENRVSTPRLSWSDGEADAFRSGGRSKSAGIWKRVRSRCTIAMLSPFPRLLQALSHALAADLTWTLADKL